MSVGSEAAGLIKLGIAPSDVAKKLGKTERVAELKRLLLTQVGEGGLLLSEIYFSIPEARRKRFQGICDGDPEIGAVKLRLTTLIKSWHPKNRDRKVSDLGPDHGLIECDLYWLSKDSPFTDTYRFLRDLETSLPRLIRRTLEHFFKAHDDAWWKEGVPVETRKRCVIAKESDASAYLEPCAYMNFIDFKTIIDSNWKAFCEVLPPSLPNERHKKQLLDSFQRLNDIRNCVMHPIKQIPLSQDDCNFVRNQCEQLRESRWKPPARMTWKEKRT